MARPRSHPKAISVVVQSAAIIALVSTGGCGGAASDANVTRPLVAIECGSVGATATESFVLDWAGATTPLYPDEYFEPLDLNAFAIGDGETLADRADEFREAVRLQVTRVFCDLPGVAARVSDAEDAVGEASATVYLTQAQSPSGDGQIGEAHYDTCDAHIDNAAVIFGGQFERLGGLFSFDDWVMMFANTTAHEIAHTLGYGHIAREDRPQDGRSLYVELMLDRHTVDELRREQRITVDQDTCPKVDRTTGRRRTHPTVGCGPASDEAFSDRPGQEVAAGE